jgi:hypothetical protein
MHAGCDHIVTATPSGRTPAEDDDVAMHRGDLNALQLAQLALSSNIQRARAGWRPALTRTLRLTGAAVAAYFVARRVLDDPQPLLAPLTALLIVQATLVGTLADTFRRILSVIAGVAVAIVFSSVVGFNIASLGFLIAASIVVGQLLRLGPHLLEVPISAMLVLGVNGAETAATSRITETIVGAAVGLLINLAFPPAVRTRSAGAAVEQFANELANLLERVADQVTHRLPADQADQWLAEARRLSALTGDLDRLLAHAEQSRRLNPRAVGSVNTGPDLRAGLDALEHSAVALRALYRSLADRVRQRNDGEELYAEDVREAFAVVLRDLALALRSFGALVRAEADDTDHPHTEELELALDSVREARARLTELLLVDPRDEPLLWELHGSLLAAIERVLRELDVEERMRQRDRRLREAYEARTPADRAVQRLRSATRQVTDRPRRRRR